MASKAFPNRPHLHISLIAGLIPAGALIQHLGWPLHWLGLFMPLTVFIITFGFTRWIAPRLTRLATLILGIAFGAVLAHLSLWLPLLLSSYIGGQGVGQLGYAIAAALFTALAVAWYILAANLPVTLLICLAILGLIQFARKRSRSQ